MTHPLTAARPPSPALLLPPSPLRPVGSHMQNKPLFLAPCTYKTLAYKTHPKLYL